MQHVSQPSDSSLCGQCVVAMIAGVSLASVIDVMGSGRSYPANIRKALKLFGVSIPSRSTPGTIHAPAGSGAAMLWGERQHWVAYEDGIWYDPAFAHPLTDLGGYDPAPQAIAIYPATR